jgi:hypothetical protein
MKDCHCGAETLAEMKYSTRSIREERRTVRVTKTQNRGGATESNAPDRLVQDGRVAVSRPARNRKLDVLCLHLGGPFCDHLVHFLCLFVVGTMPSCPMRMTRRQEPAAGKTASRRHKDTWRTSALYAAVTRTAAGTDDAGIKHQLHSPHLRPGTPVLDSVPSSSSLALSLSRSPSPPPSLPP